MQASVIIVGKTSGVDLLSYAVPAPLAEGLRPGHRVLVPLRSRKVTGVVAAIDPDSDGAGLKPVLELLESVPLYDAAHMRLLDFLAAYYMAPLADAYRSVIPALARVESRATFALPSRPNPLRLASLTPLERAIVDTLSCRPRTARELGRRGQRREVSSALARLETEGTIERRESMHGRHREPGGRIVRLSGGAAGQRVRGATQRRLIEVLSASPERALSLEALSTAVSGARAALKALERRGLATIAPAPGSGPGAAAPAGGGGPAGQSPAAPASPELTPEQEACLRAVAPALAGARFEAFLLFGVTASGKTEVYMRLAAQALEAGRRVLVLVPEIALADELVRAFRTRFGATVAVAHSAQGAAERWASWTRALYGRARVMIGPRSAIFAPLGELGLIVVDEEHDSAFKQEEGIRYNARDLAVALGEFARCPVVLGSATPSAESYLNARRGRYRMLRLERRIGERALAAVEVVDLRRDSGRPAGPTAAAPAAREPAAVPLSAPLLAALGENLAAGGQSLVFLNRRGYHNFLQCRLCGTVLACPNCSVSLTFHLRDRSLRCHYCGHRAGAPDGCPECRGFGLTGEGFGTERLATALERALPGARVERMDSDTSGRRGARASLLDRLRRGEIDILVGTQMITKGFDFPGVTLVGVVLADLTLNLPDFRAAERTFQLLTQVAGRAGRGARPGRVIIQTYSPHHYAIRAARDQDHARFIGRELKLRRELFYPPFCRLALVRIEGAEASHVSDIAARAAAALAPFAGAAALRVLGPAPAPIERVRNRYRWRVMVKSATRRQLRAALTALSARLAAVAAGAGVRLALDIDPVDMM